ncbi:hypothetical protein [Sphaerisporangium sp. NPDC051011]|uniref:DUF7224 domain-containing protein n=1 Tax=Sphaerisporangium sp. NPDC051011 TaxID=3155792 RepID=UPI0033D744E8
MSWRSRLRSAGVYVLPLAVIVAVMQARRELGSMDLCWPGASAMANSAVAVIAPIYAATAAWEAGRLRRGGVDRWTFARPWYVVVLDALTVPLAGAVLALTAASLSLLPAMAGVPGAPDLRFLGVAVLVCAGFIFLGFGLGRLLMPVYAVPISLIGTYLWLAYPISMEPLWLRHLTGNYDVACCRFDQVPDVRALVAGALVATAVIVTGLGLSLARRNVNAKRLTAGLVSVALVVGGVSVVRGLSWEVAVPRPRADLVCEPAGTSGAVPRICLWPEHVAGADRLAKAVGPAVDRLAAAGLPRPETLTEGQPTRQEWTFSYPPEPDEVAWAIAIGLVPQDVPECQAKGGQWFTGDMIMVLVSWLGLTGGESVQFIEERVGPEIAAKAREVMRRPASAQLRWFRENMKILDVCDVKPVDVK